jgi:hypothetical protein
MPQRSGIVQPDVDTAWAPNPVFPYGEAIVTQGLEVRDGIDGYGAVSRGFLWELYSIWLDLNFYDGISTSWSAGETAITTSWTDANAPITTTWTPEQYGVYGEYNS